MKFKQGLFSIFVVLTVFPAFAETPVQDSMLADQITTRIQEALKDEDYAVEQVCDENNCSITIVRK